jgi:hypothetical protein
MRSLGKLLCYIAVAGGLSGVMVYSALWLVRPDPSLRAEVHVAAIPPRIAESIARKRDERATEAAADAQAQMQPATPSIAAPAPLPVMTEANVSLSAAPEPAPLRKLARIKAKPELTPMPIESVAQEEAPRPVARRISTARSDFPY